MRNGPGLSDRGGGDGDLADSLNASAAQASLLSPELYLNRELTWLSFNRRVLAEAEDERNPLLERLKFLAITASNLDEFFIKRIGGLKQQAASGVRALTLDGRTPQAQIAECLEVIRQQEQRQREVRALLLDQLKTHGTAVLSYEELSTPQQVALREHYFTNIFPLVTPLAIDPAHPFPFVSSLSLNLLVTIRHPADELPSEPAAGEPDTALARIKVPVGSGVPRFVRVGEQSEFVLLE